MTQPWGDPNHNVLADLQEARRKGQEVPWHAWEPFIPTQTRRAIEEWQKLMQTPDSVAIVSGGLDSTTLVYDMIAQGHVPHMLSFNYGQRHRKELAFAHTTAKLLGLKHDIIDLTMLTGFISNSALTSQTGLTVRGMNFDGGNFRPNVEVPEGHYAEDTMKQTVVPNRNMIMIAIAAGGQRRNRPRQHGIRRHRGSTRVRNDA